MMTIVAIRTVSGELAGACSRALSMARRGRKTLRHGALVLCCSAIAACGGSDTMGTGTEPPLTITITPATPTVNEGGKLRLTAAVASTSGPVTGRNITWVSSNTSIATISDSGDVTGVAPGATQISASLPDGLTSSVTLNVRIDPCKVSQAVPITPNALVTGALNSADCDFGDGTYLDAYTFVLTSSTNVDILMRSAAFDAFIYLFVSTTGGLQERASDDDNGGGTDARLFGLLTTGTYYILANSNNVNGFGAYTLLLTSPFAGLNAGISMFPDAPEPIALRHLTGAETRSFRALVQRPR